MPRLTSRIEELATCNNDRKRAVSAASKLSFFANPGQSAFIVDSFARIAVEFRHPLGGQPRLTGYGNFEIAEYFSAIRKCLSDESERRDFNDALNLVTPLLDRVSHSVFQNDGAAVQDFAMRRLLDKLLYYEGKLLHHQGKLRAILNGKWLRDLRRDIAAADREYLNQRGLQAAE